jgi:hypothetical protein
MEDRLEFTMDKLTGHQQLRALALRYAIESYRGDVPDSRTLISRAQTFETYIIIGRK